MSNKFPAEELKELLKKARQADSDYRQFGAKKHRYQWNPPASVKEIEAFEKEIEVRLPEEYRNFLLLIGNGGAGPFYGLFSLKEVRKWLDWKIQPEKEPWFYPDMVISEEENEEDEDDETEWERRGCIPIGSQGDTYFTYLLVTGPNRGRVVYVEDELSYVFFPREKGFLDWYTRWLREVAGNYHIFWFGTNLDGNQEELRRCYEETTSEEERKLIFSSMGKFPALSSESKEWIVKTAQNYLYEPDARNILELLWQVSPKKKDDFMERRWEAGLYEGTVLEVYYSINFLDQNEGEVLSHWGKRILEVMPQISQKQWYMAFQLLAKCPWFGIEDVIGLWKTAKPEIKPELIRNLGRFPDAKEHMELFLEALEEREDLELLSGAVLGVPRVRDERLLASLERICREFPYTMKPVGITDWNDKAQVALWKRHQEARTICHNADIILERVRETFINPKVPGIPRPHRLLLQLGARGKLEIDNPHKEGEIAIHPLIAVVITEQFGSLPTTASEWNRIIRTIQTLKLRPEKRYWCEGSNDSSDWIYIIPPNPSCTLPKPYYYDIHDWSVIGSMENLKTLMIERICVDEFSFLTQCKNVETLSLYNTNFSDCRLLGGMKSLKKVDLRQCRLQYEEVLEKMKQNHSELSVRR